MATKVAINGFGRIGRLVARAILERDDHDLELVSINDLASPKDNALLFAFDSTHGRFPGEVTSDGDSFQVNGRDIRVTAEKDPGRLPHREMGIDLVLECTGFFQGSLAGSFSASTRIASPSTTSPSEPVVTVPGNFRWTES